MLDLVSADLLRDRHIGSGGAEPKDFAKDSFWSERVLSPFQLSNGSVTPLAHRVLQCGLSRTETEPSWKAIGALITLS